MKIYHKLFKYCYIWNLLISCALAQDKAIDSERPDQSFGSKVLEPAAIQLESGIMHTKFENGKSALINSTLLRYGLLNKVELRLLVEDGKNRDGYIEETSMGMYPLAIGSKIAIVENYKWLPNLSILAHLKLPFTSHTSDQKYWSSAFHLVLEKELEKLTIVANGGILQEAYGTNWAYSETTSLKYELAKKVNFFIEYFGDYSTREFPQHNTDIGFQFALKKYFQLDIAAGSTIYNPESNQFITMGFSAKLPTK